MVTRTPANSFELKALWEKRRYVRDHKQFALDQAKHAIEVEFAAKTEEYERELWRLHREGFSIAELGRAYESKDRATIMKILAKYDALTSVRTDEVVESVSEVFSWGAYTVPDVTLFDGRVIAGWEDYGLRANFANHGKRLITFDSWYKAVQGDDENWTFDAVPMLDEPEGGENRVLHDKTSPYYREANEWCKAHAGEYGA